METVETRTGPQENAPMLTYTSLCNDPFRTRSGETNDCGVIASAVVTGLSYEETHRIMAAKGRKPRKGTRMQWIHGICNAQGFETIDITAKVIAWGGRTNITVERVLRTHLATHKVLVLQSGGHHIGGFDGERLQDWAAGRAKRITRVLLVLPKGADKPLSLVLGWTGDKAPAPLGTKRRNAAQFRQHAVQVYNGDGEWLTYRSVRAAFAALNLPDAKHQAFRLVLKRERRADFGSWQFRLVD
jgi:hypothetical protein